MSRANSTTPLILSALRAITVLNQRLINERGIYKIKKRGGGESIKNVFTLPHPSLITLGGKTSAKIALRANYFGPLGGLEGGGAKPDA